MHPLTDAPLTAAVKESAPATAAGPRGRRGACLRVSRRWALRPALRLLGDVCAGLFLWAVALLLACGLFLTFASVVVGVAVVLWPDAGGAW